MSRLHAFDAAGIELEYMIVDRESLAVRPLAPALLPRLSPATAPDGAPLAWSNELTAHVVELKNARPSRRLEPLLAGFETQVERANAALAAHGARLMPTGMHPWMDPARETQLWTSDDADIYAAYHRIFDCRRHGFANVQAMHVNLPFASDAEFACLHGAVRLLMPLMPALAASSPLCEGERTRHLDERLAVYRTHAGNLPTITGRVVPEPVSSRTEYERRILRPMYEEIAPQDPQGVLQHEWLNARGAIARFDRQALEIRVLDVQECPLADLAVAAAVISVVRAIYEREASLPHGRATLVTDRLAAIFETCVRDGDRAAIVDTSYLSMLGYPGAPCTAGELWAHLIADCAPDSPVQSPVFRDAVDALLDEGPLARRIARAVGRAPSRERLVEIYGELCDCLGEGRMFLPD